jgi:hypothetical protein
MKKNEILEYQRPLGSVRYISPVMWLLTLIAVTPVAAAAALFAGHIDHGFLVGRVIFPYSALVIWWSAQGVTPFAIVTTVGQFPLYGILMAVSARKRRAFEMGVFLATCHLIGVIVCVVGVVGDFFGSHSGT